MNNPKSCRAILMGDRVVIWNWSDASHETLATFYVATLDRKSLRQRIDEFEATNNCVVENYTDGMLGKYRAVSQSQEEQGRSR